MYAYENQPPRTLPGTDGTTPDPMLKQPMLRTKPYTPHLQFDDWDVGGVLDDTWRDT